MDMLDTRRGSVALTAVLKLQNAVSSWLDMPEFRMAHNSRGPLDPVLRHTGLRLLLSPTRDLILIGLFLSFGALLLSLKGIHDNVCPVDPKDHNRFGVNFCGFTNPQAEFVEGLQILRPANPTRHYLVEIVAPPRADSAAGRSASGTAPSPGKSTSQ